MSWRCRLWLLVSSLVSLQDSAETAPNSSTDVLFTAAACMAEDKSLLDTMMAAEPVDA